MVLADRKFWSFSACLIANYLQLPELLKRWNYSIVKVLAILAEPPRF
jgi:hypothetical protein